MSIVCAACPCPGVDTFGPCFRDNRPLFLLGHGSVIVELMCVFADDPGPGSGGGGIDTLNPVLWPCPMRTACEPLRCEYKKIVTGAGNSPSRCAATTPLWTSWRFSLAPSHSIMISCPEFLGMILTLGMLSRLSLLHVVLTTAFTEIFPCSAWIVIMHVMELCSRWKREFATLTYSLSITICGEVGNVYWHM